MRGWSTGLVGVALAAFAAPTAFAADSADAGGSDDAGTLAEAAVEPDTSALQSLLSEQVVSAASRTAETASEAPATTWIIRGTDLPRYGIQSIEEAIRYLGHAMTSYEYDAREDAAFGARGYMSDNLGLHVAVLIDGNDAGGSAKTARGTQMYLMPIELVDHIEVIIGPGSVLYGGSAMLGVINVVTKAPQDIHGIQTVAQVSGGLPSDPWAKNISWGEAWVRSATWGGYSWVLGGKPLDLEWHFDARWDRQEGRSMWRQISGTDPYALGINGYTREDVFNRDLHTKLFAKATWDHWTFMGWVGVSGGTGTGPIDGDGSSSYFEPEYGLDARWAKPVGSRGDLSLRFYGVVWDSQARIAQTIRDPQHCIDTVGTPDCSDTLHYVNYRPFFEPMLTWDWLRDGTQVSTFGGQAFIDGSVIYTGTEATDGSAKTADPPIHAPLPNAALFVQHIWRARYGTLNAGLREDVGYLGNALSPRGAYSLSPWTNGTLKVSASSAFRLPTITERYLTVPGFLVENTSLRPEKVYSAEVDLAQRLGLHSIDLALFATSWKGMIGAVSLGGGLYNFANFRDVWSAGANLGWHGESGPLDWGLSVNYAPGRTRLPADVTGYSDSQLAALGVSRTALDQYGSSALGSILFQSDGMPDFYSTGHLSYSLGAGLPRLSLAANLNSPRPLINWLPNSVILDPRFAPTPFIPWTVDARAAIESGGTGRFGWRLVVTARSFGTNSDGPRVGDITAPQPQGGIGWAYTPVAQLSAMAEVHARF